ncbi:hypothetical protein [Brevibacterium oceani]|uniref:hypothetical protein n=1 Tax=Brevibacterium oceani TaxID=358099 RepID=UPI0015E69461|nr:hypothetical protein [Brevibacterium oceani]
MAMTVFGVGAIILSPTAGFPTKDVSVTALTDEIASDYDLVDLRPEVKPRGLFRMSREIPANDLCGPIDDDSPILYARVPNDHPSHAGVAVMVSAAIPDCEAEEPTVNLHVIDAHGTGITADDLKKDMNPS